MKNGSVGGGDTRVLLTAAEAYPFFEELVLGARSTVVAGFRIFDPGTRLRSDAGREIGSTWADLLAEIVARGVDLTMMVSDFDPVHRPGLHRGAHASVRGIRKAVEARGARGKLEINAVMHPAQAGYWHRLAFRPLEIQTIMRHVEKLNSHPVDFRTSWLEDAPGFRRFVEFAEDHSLALRKWVLPLMQPASHHQKLAVIDGEQLYVGGLDLNERRYDDQDHDKRASQTWHDIQICMSGPVAAVAEGHLLNFQAECAGRQPVAERPGLLRTLSRARGKFVPRLGPETLVSEIRQRLVSEIRKAERLIYIETQYLRDLEIAGELADRAEKQPGLNLIAILPAAPEDVAFEGSSSLDAKFGEYLQARCVTLIQKAFGKRVTFLSPAQQEDIDENPSDFDFNGAPLVYVHAKVAIFDEACAIIGSANLNGRSLSWDTEVAVALEAGDTVRDLRRRLFEHWLPEDAGDEFHDPDKAVRAWEALAMENAGKEPDEREGFLMPFPLDRAKKFGRWVPIVPHAMV